MPSEQVPLLAAVSAALLDFGGSVRQNTGSISRVFCVLRIKVLVNIATLTTSDLSLMLYYRTETIISIAFGIVTLCYVMPSCAFPLWINERHFTNALFGRCRTFLDVD